MFFNHEPKPKKILEDSTYAQTRMTYSLLKQAQTSQGTATATTLNTRMVNNDYAVPILNSLENVFYFEENFFTPNSKQIHDVNMRKNAQKCLKILFDYTNLPFKEIFKLLTDSEGSKLWINNKPIESNDAIGIACNALGLDRIFKKGLFRGLKTKIDKLKNLNKSYEQKATLFSRLVECNKDLQKLIFSALDTKPCKYSEKYDTHFAAKQAERKQQNKASKKAEIEATS